MQKIAAKLVYILKDPFFRAILGVSLAFNSHKLLSSKVDPVYGGWLFVGAIFVVLSLSIEIVENKKILQNREEEIQKLYKVLRFGEKDNNE